MTDKELLQFYEDHKDHYIEVYDWVDFEITLGDLFKMFKLVIQQEASEPDQSSTE